MIGRLLDKIEQRMLIVEPKSGAGRVRRISSGNLFRDLGDMIQAQKLEETTRSLSGILSRCDEMSGKTERAIRYP
jgi:hypothetical protein